MENGTSLFQKPDDPPLLTYPWVSVHLQVHVLYLTSMSRWEIRLRNNHWQVWKNLIHIVRVFHPSQSKYWTSQCIGRFQTSGQIGPLSKERYLSKNIHTGCRTVDPVISLTCFLEVISGGGFISSFHSPWALLGWAPTPTPSLLSYIFKLLGITWLDTILIFVLFW